MFARNVNPKQLGRGEMKSKTSIMMDIGYYIERVQELPPRVLLKKALTKPVAIAACKLEKVRTRLSPPHISDEQFRESLNGFASLREAVDHIRSERPKFFIEPSKREILISFIQGEFPQLKDQVIAEADKVCSHIFDLLGSGDISMDEFAAQHGGRQACGYLPWYFDFKTGYRWSSKKFYKEIEIPYGKADIKVPWELSRFQHVSVLGQAYWLTGDEKYVQEFIGQVDNWIDCNPPKFGVNWACTMDVAIRVANWIWGFYFFKDSEALTDEFLIKFLKSLLTHGRHIMANLENKGITTNHYLADLAGLIYLGVTFPEFKEAKRWREFGIQELIKEMGKQVYDDGMDFEASTCYHRLALELFFYPTLLCKLNGVELPDSFIEKLEKMFDFVLYVLKPNGRMPQIGDNDNGRLHILGKRDILDMTYLLAFAILFLDDPKYKIEEFDFAPDALWLFGPKAYEKWEEMSGRSVEALESRAFPNGGIYVMRRHKKDYMIISCCPNGQGGNGGHAHNDKLSIELCADGEDIIADPGTYVYTVNPEWRNKFRSTAYHNTVAVDQEEQNRFNASNLFSMKNDATVEIKEWKVADEYDFLDAQHDGYQRLRNLIIGRQIYFNKVEGYWIIKDIMNGRERHHFDLYFHFALLEIEVDKEFPLVVKAKLGAANLAIIPLEAEGFSVEISEGWVSYCYGVKKRAPMVRYSKRNDAPISFSYILYPYKKKINIEKVIRMVNRRSPCRM